MEIEQTGINYSVDHQGQPRKINFIGEYESNGYVDVPFYFTDESLDANGVFVVIRPHTATKVLKVLDPNVRFEDGVMAGSGWFLGINPNGKIVTEKVDSSNELYITSFGAGWTFCWIAGENGLAIIDTTAPAFRPDMEEEIVRGSKNDSLPRNFWHTYDGLLSKGGKVSSTPSSA